MYVRRTPGISKDEKSQKTKRDKKTFKGQSKVYAWPSGEVFRDYKYLYAEIYFVPGNFFNLPNIPFSVP